MYSERILKTRNQTDACPPPRFGPKVEPQGFVGGATRGPGRFSVPSGTRRLRSAGSLLSLGSRSAPFRLNPVPLWEGERRHCRRRRSRLLLHWGPCSASCFHFLPSELYPGRCFPYCFSNRPRTVQILFFFLLLLVQANKVFLSFFFFP